MMRGPGGVFAKSRSRDKTRWKMDQRVRKAIKDRKGMREVVGGDLRRDLEGEIPGNGIVAVSRFNDVGID